MMDGAQSESSPWAIGRARDPCLDNPGSILCCPKNIYFFKQKWSKFTISLKILKKRRWKVLWYTLLLNAAVVQKNVFLPHFRQYYNFKATCKMISKFISNPTNFLLENWHSQLEPEFKIELMLKLRLKSFINTPK